jgi:PAS domain-containing protein
MTEKNNNIVQLKDQIKALQAEIAKINEIEAEKNRIQQLQQEADLRFKTIFNESSLGKKIINTNLEIINVNSALVKLLGYSKEELLGNLITNISHPDYIRLHNHTRYFAAHQA